MEDNPPKPKSDLQLVVKTIAVLEILWHGLYTLVIAVFGVILVIRGPGFLLGFVNTEENKTEFQKHVEASIFLNLAIEILITGFVSFVRFAKSCSLFKGTIQRRQYKVRSWLLYSVILWAITVVLVILAFSIGYFVIPICAVGKLLVEACFILVVNVFHRQLLEEEVENTKPEV